MFKSFNNLLLTSYIKNLLKDEVIIDIPFFKPGMLVYPGEKYRIGDAIVIAENNPEDQASQDAYKPKSSNYWKEGDWNIRRDTKTNKILRDEYTNKTIHKNKNNYPFKFLRSIYELHKDDYKRFVSNTSYYDDLTHYYFIKYLVYLRDYKNLNLLPLVNVWGGQTLSNLHMTYSSDGSISLERTNVESIYEILKVDIDINQDYTLFIDSPIPVLMGELTYDKGKMLNVHAKTAKTLLTNQKYYPCMNWKQPVEFKTYLDPDLTPLGYRDYLIYKNYATLLIRLPKGCKNKVILNGKYKTLPRVSSEEGNNNYGKLSIPKSVYNHASIPKLDIDYWSTDILNGFKDTPLNDTPADLLYPELLEEGAIIKGFLKAIPNLNDFSNGRMISDKLFQYLLNYHMHSSDDNSEDIKSFKEFIRTYAFSKSTGLGYTNSVNDEYDESFRKWVYNLESKIKTSNLTGFVDKEVEDYIRKLKKI